MEDLEGRDEALEADEQVLEGDEDSQIDAGDNEPATLDKRLSDTQKAFHESRAEAKELREKLAKMEGMMEVLSKGPVTPPEQQPDPFAEVYDESFWDDFYDDPKKLQKLTKKQIEVIGGTILQERKARSELEKKLAAMEGALKDLRAGVNKPDPALDAQIQKLKKDPDFADLPDDVLARFAKKMPSYAGGPSVSARVQSKGGDPSLKGMSPEAKALMNEVLKRHGKKGV